MLDEIVTGLARHKLVPFFGAGVSAPQLRVLWKDISDEMARLASIPDDQRGDFLAVADAFVSQKGAAALADLLGSRLIASEFDDVKGWSHLFLLSLNAGVLYTTNQDNLFELASVKKGRPYRLIVQLEDLAESDPGERLLIKYHGDLSVPDSVIFTGSSYYARIADVRHFLNIRMQADLLAKGFFFVGYSFQDPNVHLLFRELRAAFGDRMPRSFLIAYQYDASMERLHDDFGVEIIDPKIYYPDAADHDEAFKRLLKQISERVLEMKSKGEISNLFTPSVPPSIRIATEFDVDSVIEASKCGDFARGLGAYRSLLDRTAIPEELERNVLDAFKRLCDAARTNQDLIELAAAVFNLSLPHAEAAEAISRLMVAINRVDHDRGFPDFIIVSPGHPDELVSVAAALAVADIKGNGGQVKEAFRQHARNWMSAFHKLTAEMQAKVRHQMEVAWRDGGSSIPRHLFDSEGPFRAKPFGELRDEMLAKLPRNLGRPPN